MKILIKISIEYSFFIYFILKHAVGALLFLIYGTMSCGFWLLAFLFVTETRRKIPEHVQILVKKGTVYKAKHQQ